jgi:molybdenum cofactor guanylyltransferase
MKTRISGVILTGGISSRFGGINKSKLFIEGSTIISRMLLIINDIFDEKIIVTNASEEFYEFSGCKIAADHYKKAGPLGGIHSALKLCTTEAIFVFAGDMPFLNKKIILNQIENFNRSEYDILVPEIGELIEPLHAIYRIRILKDLEKFLSEGTTKAVRDFISGFNVGFMKIPDTAVNGKAFTNINSPADITKISF